MTIWKRILTAIPIIALSACAAPPLAPPAPTASVKLPGIVVDNTEGTRAAQAAETPAPDRKPNEYNITVEINMDERTVTGTELLSYQNKTDAPLTALWLNAYLNAFSEGAEPKPFFDRFAPRIFERGEDYARLNVLSVRRSGAAANFTLTGTALRVELAEPLEPGMSAELAIAFEAYIPNINHRAGANAFALWCGSLFPMAAVLDGDGWHTDGYYPAGSPFYGEPSNWTVQVVTPKACIVAGTGEETTTEAGDKRTTTITGRMTRGFAFAVSPYYDMQTLKTGGGVYINFYTYSGIDGTPILEAAERALDQMGRLVGAYPYFSYDIIETGLFSTETESYGGLTFMDTDYLHAPLVAALSAPADVARQYFGGVVGSNRFKETWVSEGIATFLGRMIRLETEAALTDDMAAEHTQLTERLKHEPRPSMKDSLDAYADWNNYADSQRYRARQMCYSLRGRMGAERFAEFLKTYYAQYSFRQASGEDFKRLAAEVSGEDLTDFFQKWINEDELPPLRGLEGVSK